MKVVDLHLTHDEETSILDAGTRHVYRSAPVGRAYDTFTANGKRFEIIDVSERSVDTIVNQYYRLENCDSPGDFIRGWKASHSGKWDPQQRVYIHWFREIMTPLQNDLI